MKQRPAQNILMVIGRLVRKFNDCSSQPFVRIKKIRVCCFVHATFGPNHVNQGVAVWLWPSCDPTDCGDEGTETMPHELFTCGPV